MKHRRPMLFCVCMIFFSLTGCQATHTAISKRNIVTKTHMSHTIFVEPSSMSPRNVFVKVNNNSGTVDKHLSNLIKESLTAGSNILISSNPSNSDYLIQVNLIQYGISLPDIAQKSLKSGYGSAIEGVWLGNKIAKSKNNKSSFTSLIGASIATVANAIVEENMYTIVADVQISQLLDEDSGAKGNIKAKLKQGKNTIETISYNNKPKWIKYQTRVVSSVSKVNLSFDTACMTLYLFFFTR